VITPSISGISGSYKVTALTVTSGGTCTLVPNGTTTLGMYIADEPQAAYGIYLDIANASADSLIANFGTRAAIADEVGMVITNAHPENSPCLVDYGRTGVYIGADLD
jgi:hypothetical protein